MIFRIVEFMGEPYESSPSHKARRESNQCIQCGCNDLATKTRCDLCAAVSVAGWDFILSKWPAMVYTPRGQKWLKRNRPDEYRALFEAKKERQNLKLEANIHAHI